MTLRDNIIWAKSLSKGYRRYIALNIILGGVSVGLSLLFIFLCKSLVDSAVNGLDKSIFIPSIQIAGVLIIQIICNFFRGRIESYSSAAMMNKLRERLFYRVILSRWNGREKFHTGDITTRLEGDARKVSETLCRFIPIMAVAALEFLFSFIFMFSMNSRLAWLLFAIMPVALLLSKRYMVRMRSLTHSIREVDSSVQAHIQEQIQHRSVINSMGNAIGSFTSLQRLSAELFDKSMQRSDYILYSRAVVRLGFSAGYLTAFLWGINGISSGAVSFGMMTAFLQLVAKVQAPIVEISSYISTIAQTTTSIDRLGELDDLEIEEQGEDQILSGDVGVRFSGVVFSYGGRDILSDFECDFKANALHVIIGETGSGKSTMLRLILGFLKPFNGVVELYNNDENIACSPLTRANFVYVPQGNTLISGTIRDNILLSDPEATDEEIAAVLHTAVAEFVYQLPDGLDTICGERGAGLSEGEAQRVAIARGLLRKGGVILLDEPTSALDSITEQLLIERLTIYAQNRTMIMVTHREHTSEICNSVVKLTR
ncbi:MAG: ABC transporter ATP-binding protein [Rikenellaceae bacterium]